MDFINTFQKSQRAFFALLLISAPLFLSSCVSIRSAPEVDVSRTPTKSVSSRPGTATKKTSQSATRGFKTHVVAPGETLWRIGKKYGLSVNELTRLNNIDPRAPIHPGDRLRVSR